MRFTQLLCGLLLLASISRAEDVPLEPKTVNGLAFETVLKDVHASASADQVTVEFAFENVSDSVVRLGGLEVHCSCLKGEIVPAELYPNGIKPGEKGMIRSVFELGQFRGTVEKTIGVLFEGDEKASLALRVRVHVPVLFEIEPQTLIWELGGATETQTFDIKVTHENPINILKHTVSSQVFPYEVEIVEPGRRYKVHVTPTSTEKPGLGVLSFLTDCDIEKHRRRQAFVVVRKPLPEQP